ncbi:Obg-like ATPase [Bulinus truncatus]|nr:Obg-like ATPase [Bulinus truncatus]
MVQRWCISLDEEIIHLEGEFNLLTLDLEIIHDEIGLKDLGTCLSTLSPWIEVLLEEEQIRRREGAGCFKSKIEVLNQHLVSTCPKTVIYLVNLSEKDYARRKNKWLLKIKEWIDAKDPWCNGTRCSALIFRASQAIRFLQAVGFPIIYQINIEACSKSQDSLVTLIGLAKNQKHNNTWVRFKNRRAVYANSLPGNLQDQNIAERLAKNGEGLPKIIGDVFIHPTATVHSTAVLYKTNKIPPIFNFIDFPQFKHMYIRRKKKNDKYILSKCLSIFNVTELSSAQLVLQVKRVPKSIKIDPHRRNLTKQKDPLYLQGLGYWWQGVKKQSLAAFILSFQSV